MVSSYFRRREIGLVQERRRREKQKNLVARETTQIQRKRTHKQNIPELQRTLIQIHHHCSDGKPLAAAPRIAPRTAGCHGRAGRPCCSFKRFFAASAHEHDDAEETYKWRNITVAAYIACIGLGIYTLSGEEPHGSEQPAYSYLHIRSKEFPWGPNGLFEHKHESHEEA